MNSKTTTLTTRQVALAVKPARIPHYPAEFLIACGIYQLKTEELLQHFVNRFYYTGLMCGAEDDTEHAVNEVIFDYLSPITKGIGIAAADQVLHRRWLKKLNVIINRDWKLPDQELKANMSSTLQTCRMEICTNREQASSVCVPGGFTIQLTSDFMVMCFMYGISATCVLQHLVENISLAKEAAFNQFGHAVFNPFMNFFHSIGKQFFQDSKALQLSGFYQYDKELVALYERMKEEQDYEKRLAALTKHYKGWYASMQIGKVEKVDKLYGKKKPRKAKTIRE